MMKEWLEQIASDVEEKYGEEVCNQIFGDIQSIPEEHEAERQWFNKFIQGMNELKDKEFLTDIMVSRCPCSHNAIENNIRTNYEKSQTLEEFVSLLNQDGLFDDTIKLCGNILYATKRSFEKHGSHSHTGPYATTCHCHIGSHAQQPITDIFCHCCTVGFYGKMFRNALGKDIVVEFKDSIITGGKGCTAAIHLPKKIHIKENYHD